MHVRSSSHVHAVLVAQDGAPHQILGEQARRNLRRAETDRFEA